MAQPYSQTCELLQGPLQTRTRNLGRLSSFRAPSHRPPKISHMHSHSPGNLSPDTPRKNAPKPRRERNQVNRKVFCLLTSHTNPTHGTVAPPLRPFRQKMHPLMRPIPPLRPFLLLLLLLRSLRQREPECRSRTAPWCGTGSSRSCSGTTRRRQTRRVHQTALCTAGHTCFHLWTPSHRMLPRLCKHPQDTCRPGHHQHHHDHQMEELQGALFLRPPSLLSPHHGLLHLQQRPQHQHRQSPCSLRRHLQLLQHHRQRHRSAREAPPSGHEYQLPFPAQKESKPSGARRPCHAREFLSKHAKDLGFFPALRESSIARQKKHN